MAESAEVPDEEKEVCRALYAHMCVFVSLRSTGVSHCMNDFHTVFISLLDDNINLCLPYIPL